MSLATTFVEKGEEATLLLRDGSKLTKIYIDREGTIHINPYQPLRQDNPSQSGPINQK